MKPLINIVRKAKAMIELTEEQLAMVSGGHQQHDHTWRTWRDTVWGGPLGYGVPFVTPIGYVAPQQQTAPNSQPTIIVLTN
jgi:hypothetical protein